jgi:hypothetical protein
VQAHAAELDDVAVAERRGARAAAGDEDPVQRAVVEDAGALLVADDQGVAAGDGRAG